MKRKTTKAINILSNIGYIIGCVILYLIAISIIFSAVWNIVHEMMSRDYSVYNLLNEVGLIVFAIAVIEISKYLLFEDVLRQEKERVPREYRKALTKFSIIIASALALEGLVLTFEMAKQDITKILYPVAVLITAILFIIGIGIYQKFNASAEKK